MNSPDRDSVNQHRDSNQHSVESTDGVMLTLHHLGGAGTPLLISHATGFHGRTYEQFASHLTRTFDVWAVDLRGHGATPPPESGDFAWVGMAADVEAAINYILADSPEEALHTIGHSMGAASVLRVACTTPELLHAAYVFEPIVFPDRSMVVERDSVMSRAARARRAEFGSRAEVRERYGSRPPLSFLTPEALHAYVEYGFVDTTDGVTLACTPENEARTFEAPDKMVFDDLTACAIPVLVGAAPATEDFSPANMAPGIAAAIPDGTLSVHDELSHFGPLQDPAKIAREALDFFVTA